MFHADSNGQLYQSKNTSAAVNLKVEDIIGPAMNP